MEPDMEIVSVAPDRVFLGSFEHRSGHFQENP